MLGGETSSSLQGPTRLDSLLSCIYLSYLTPTVIFSCKKGVHLKCLSCSVDSQSYDCMRRSNWLEV